MPEISYTSRRELDQHRFHPAAALLAPLVCLILQVLLPRLWSRLGILDLPLIATIYFAVSRRSPITGTVTGSIIGLFQDGLTNNPFGIFGIAKGLVGYIAASIGFAIDTDNPINRALITFSGCILQSSLVYLIRHWLLGDHTFLLQPIHELLRAVFTTAIAIPLYYTLDNFRQRD